MVGNPRTGRNVGRHVYVADARFSRIGPWIPGPWEECLIRMSLVSKYLVVTNADGGSRDRAVHVGGSHAGAAPAARVPAPLRRDCARGRRRRLPCAPRHTLRLQPILPVSYLFIIHI